MNRILITACVAVVMFATTAYTQQRSGVVVVVSAANATTSLTVDEVSRIFLKRDRRWPNGDIVVPVDLDQKSRAKEAFVRRFHGRSLDAFDNYWQQQVFSGREAPPAVRTSAAEVLEFVARNPGGIGYVPAGTPLPAGVRALQVVES